MDVHNPNVGAVAENHKPIPQFRQCPRFKLFGGSPPGAFRRERAMVAAIRRSKQREVPSGAEA